MSTGEAGQRWVRPSRQARRVTPCLKAAGSPASAPLPQSQHFTPSHSHTPLLNRGPLCPEWAKGWGASLSSPSPWEPLGTCCKWARRKGKGKGGSGAAAPLRGVRPHRPQEGDSGSTVRCLNAHMFFLVQVAPTTSFSLHGDSLSYGPGKREGHAKGVWP